MYCDICPTFSYLFPVKHKSPIFKKAKFLYQINIVADPFDIAKKNLIDISKIIYIGLKKSIYITEMMTETARLLTDLSPL